MVFPDKFLSHLLSCPGFDLERFVAAHELKPPISLRLNANKKYTHPFSNKVPWTKTGYYLSERPQFVFDPLFHAGAYYVQEASGMFVEYILNKTVNFNQTIQVLDLCAAPGGKSTIIASLINESSILVSNEIIKTRVSALKENITKWGYPNVIVTNNDPADFKQLTEFFDVILVDAPCSGSGLFRKDFAATQEWSMDNVLHCEKRQKRILQDVLPALKVGGTLIYTTCSFSKEENEDVVENLIAEHGMQYINIDIPEDWGIVKSNFGFRFYPDKLQGEGFFASALIKKQETEIFESTSTHYAPYTILNKEEFAPLLPYIKNPESLTFFSFKDTVYGIAKEQFSNLKRIAPALRVVQAGTEIGKIIRDELIPAHVLAVSEILNPTINKIALTQEEAIQYLRKENVQINSELNGWVICTFENINLGWIKIMPNRINNYYPLEWRIRK